MMSEQALTVGVICELNPLHNGHVYLLREARRLAGTQGCVICVMSGRTTQRGELAILDPFTRGRMALMGGADLVVELPFPWSSGSAESFARAGVHILSQLGVTHLIFGSECGDIQLLSCASALTQTEDFAKAYAESCCQGKGTAVAYVETLSCLIRQADTNCPAGFPSSNDLLGLAYLSAITALNLAVIPHTVKREGQDYRDILLTNPAYPSATALRALIKSAAEDPLALSAMLEGTMPPAALELLLQEISEGRAPVDMTPLYAYEHMYFRLIDPEKQKTTAEMSDGLNQYLSKCAMNAATPAEFLTAINTKQYTHARLQRGMLFAVTQVTRDDLYALPTYAQLLAANETGCRYLKTIKKAEVSSVLTVVTKPADAPEGRQKHLASKVDALFTLCLPHPTESGCLMKRHPFFEMTS